MIYKTKIIYILAIVLPLIVFGIFSLKKIGCGDFYGRGYPIPWDGGECNNPFFEGNYPLYLFANLGFWFSLIFIPIFLATWAFKHKRGTSLLWSLVVAAPVIVILLSPLGYCREGGMGLDYKFCLKIPLTLGQNNLRETHILQYKHGFPFPYLYYWIGSNDGAKNSIVNNYSLSSIFLLADYLIFSLIVFLFPRRRSVA
ncbi:MAG: hypothetical protein Q7S09_01560 [bacterium]|nr:hypothetical protein [bacterium]